MKQQLSQSLKVKTKTLFKFNNQKLNSGPKFFWETEVPTTTVTVDPTTSTTVTVTH
ncbi:hypothetical protein [Mucilaginibacter sp. CSA2-8R]|uniref:hypothetical protein n=1 Tax=Mucilaginibacter sp. CSA2-8R TaxID=3141542 RepID=UPI00315DC97A